MLGNNVLDDLFADCSNRFLNLLGCHQLGALVVHHFALVIGNIVVLEQVLSDIEVVSFDLALRALDLAC